MKSEKSVHAFYKAMLDLRKKYAAFRRGDFKVLSNPIDNYFMFKRSCNDESFIVVCNFECATEITYSMRGCSLMLSNNKARTNGNSIYNPYEVAIYKEME